MTYLLFAYFLADNLLIDTSFLTWHDQTYQPGLSFLSQETQNQHFASSGD